jgi:hypothetical protein
MDQINEDIYKRVELFQNALHQEQGFFWNRFTAFATLHAGLFVVSTSGDVQAHLLPRMVILILGFLLSLSWAAIQWLSLQYVDRPKVRYYDLARKLGLEPQEESLGRRLSSTDLAFWSVIPVVLMWGTLLYIAVTKST